jgi:hypothetical protein
MEVSSVRVVSIPCLRRSGCRNCVVASTMSKFSLKGIVVGGITDILATNIFAIPLMGYLLTRIDVNHLSRNQIQTTLVATLQANTPLYMLQLLVGMACSVLGGYVGARFAKHDELLNGSFTSFLCVAFGLYSLTEGRGSGSPLASIGFVASPCLGLLGGYLRLAQKRSGETRLQPTQS